MSLSLSLSHSLSLSLFPATVLRPDAGSVHHPWPGLVGLHVLLLQGPRQTPVLGFWSRHSRVSGESLLRFGVQLRQCRGAE